MHTGRGSAPDPLPLWGVVVVVCLVLLASRSPQEACVTLHLPHALDTEGGEREGDKGRQEEREVPRAASGRVDTRLGLTCGPKASFRSYTLGGRGRPVHASCQGAVLRRAIDRSTTLPGLSLSCAAPAPR